MVATWCWPQPLGQPLILIDDVGRLGDEVRVLVEMLTEEAGEPSRLRDGKLARLGARTAGDVAHRAGVVSGEIGRRQSRIERLDLAGRHPPEHEVLVRRDAHGAIAVSGRQVSRLFASARL